VGAAAGCRTTALPPYAASEELLPEDDFVEDSVVELVVEAVEVDSFDEPPASPEEVDSLDELEGATVDELDERESVL
jgi:hypothetical protein